MWCHDSSTSMLFLLLQRRDTLFSPCIFSLSNEYSTSCVTVKDTIRLWFRRAGYSLLWDIEILLTFEVFLTKLRNWQRTFYAIVLCSLDRENLVTLGSKPEINFQRSWVSSCLDILKISPGLLFADFWHINTVKNLAQELLQ